MLGQQSPKGKGQLKALNQTKLECKVEVMSRGFADSIIVAVKLEAYDGHGDMTRGNKPQ